MSTTKITPQEAVADLKKRDQKITKSKAVAMVKKFKSQSEKITYPDFLSYNGEAITKLLSQEGCIGLRIYPAVNDNNEFTLVMVGIDGENNNILLDSGSAETMSTSVEKSTSAVAAETVEADGDEILDEGQASPPYPPPTNGL